MVVCIAHEIRQWHQPERLIWPQSAAQGRSTQLLPVFLLFVTANACEVLSVFTELTLLSLQLEPLIFSVFALEGKLICLISLSSTQL